MMDFNWNHHSPSSSQESLVLTAAAQIPANGNLAQGDWPYAVGSVDFSLYDNGEGPTIQTIIPANVPKAANLGQPLSTDEIDNALNPLERLQRKWGIGDRKTRDGQPAKRRGPKPDSKPAMTRRQELNRQAQRTHRERKESYMRELEVTIDHLRSIYAKDVVRIRLENEKLRDLLQAHGIHVELGSPVESFTPSRSMSIGGSSTSYHTAAQSTNATTNFNSMSPPSNVSSAHISPTTSQSHHQFHHQQSHQSQHQHLSGSIPNTTYSTIPPHSSSKGLQPPSTNMHGLDYEDVGLGFVADLEEDCMNHAQLLVHKSFTDPEIVSGHGLMALAVPIDHVRTHGMEVKWACGLPAMQKPDLSRMLSLCDKMPGLSGEMTPVMAWAHVLSHPRVTELSENDVEEIKKELKPKVVCYGFGAVMEDFEVKDVVKKIFDIKSAIKQMEVDDEAYTSDESSITTLKKKR